MSVLQFCLAFLSEEIIELRNVDVDINPQYADSIDVEIFKLHLMFDQAARNENPPPNHLTTLLPYTVLGPDSFRSGLDEVSYLHHKCGFHFNCLRLFR